MAGRPPGSTRPPKLSPKARIALRAVAVAGLKHREAAVAAGIHPAYVSKLKNSQMGQQYVAQLDASAEERTMESSELLRLLGREAIHRLANMMRFSQNETVALRAAQDLADRAPETQKVQRHHVEAFTLSGKDAQELARAMVESSRLKEQFITAAQGDYIRVPIDPQRIEEDTESFTSP